MSDKVAAALHGLTEPERDRLVHISQAVESFRQWLSARDAAAFHRYVTEAALRCRCGNCSGRSKR